MSSRRTFRVWLASLALMAIAGVWLGSMVHDARDLVKIRNALLVEVGPPDAFDWRPDSRPASFRTERLPAPDEIRAAARNALAPESRESGFQTALQLARHLARNRQRDSMPIQKSTVEAYRAIVDHGQGYCADYTQVFNGLAHAVGLEIREWGMAFEGYGGNGHAFSEVFDQQLRKWVFLDSFYSLYATDGHGTLLSATEFRDRLLTDAGDLQVIPILPEKFGFRTPEMALAYYRRGATSFYLWWGNDVFTYDAHPIVGRLGNVSRSGQQLAATILGIQPDLMVAAGHVQREGLLELRLIQGLLITLALAVAGFAVTSPLLLLSACRHTATDRLRSEIGDS